MAKQEQATQVVQGKRHIRCPHCNGQKTKVEDTRSALREEFGHTKLIERDQTVRCECGAVFTRSLVIREEEVGITTHPDPKMKKENATNAK